MTRGEFTDVRLCVSVPLLCACRNHNAPFNLSHVVIGCYHFGNTLMKSWPELCDLLYRETLLAVQPAQTE